MLFLLYCVFFCYFSSFSIICNSKSFMNWCDCGFLLGGSWQTVIHYQRQQNEKDFYYEVLEVWYDVEPTQTWLHKDIHLENVCVKKVTVLKCVVLHIVLTWTWLTTQCITANKEAFFLYSPLIQIAVGSNETKHKFNSRLFLCHLHSQFAFTLLASSNQLLDVYVKLILPRLQSADLVIAVKLTVCTRVCRCQLSPPVSTAVAQVKLSGVH